MKKLIIILFIALISKLGVTQNQNLVPNSSFEIYSSCPDAHYQIERAIPWFKGCRFGSGYYNSCANSGVAPYVGVPYNNDSCNYLPAKSGNAYAGIYAELDQYYNTRVYLEVKLTEPLQANTGYYAGFWICSHDCHCLTMDMVGMYFSVDSVWCPQNQIPPVNLINAVPQVNNTPGNVLTDTANWTLISGYFKANGGEQFLVIGNFYPWNQTTWYWTQPQGYPRAYYFIDDVFVYEDSLTTALPQAVTDNLPDISFFPNPSGGKLYLRTEVPLTETVTLTLFTMDGRKVKEILLPSVQQDTETDISDIKEGFYIVFLQAGQKTIITTKLAIVN